MLSLPEVSIALILILTSLTVIFSLLFMREHYLRKKNPAGEKIIEQYREKGLNLLHDSMQKSQNIIGEAELEGIKVVAQTLTNSEKNIALAQEGLIKFFSDLQTRASEFENSSRASTQERINKMFDNLENRLSEFLIATEQKSTESIELEITGARKMIETYKQQQLSLIDENIIAMMEQTLNIVLSKKLSLKDQMDLIYEALEKAKVEKFIV